MKYALYREENTAFTQTTLTSSCLYQSFIKSKKEDLFLLDSCTNKRLRLSNNKKNVDEHFRSCLFLLEYAYQKAVYKPAAISNYKFSGMKTFYKGYFANEDNNIYFLVPRARNKKELEEYKFCQEYTVIFQSIIEIKNYCNFVKAQDTLEKMNILKVNRGGKSKKGKMLTQISYKPIDEWDTQIFEFLQQETILPFVYHYSILENFRRYNKGKYEEGKQTYSDGKIEYTLINGLNTEINNHNMKFQAFSELLYNQHRIQKKNDEWIDLRLYSLLASMKSKARMKVFKYFGYVEIDQRSSIINHYRYLNTGSFYESHPVKEFGRVIAINIGITDEEMIEFFVNHIYKASIPIKRTMFNAATHETREVIKSISLKEVVLRSFYSTEEQWEKIVKNYLDSLGLRNITYKNISTHWKNISDNIEDPNVYKKINYEYKKKRISNITAIIEKLPDYNENKKQYDLFLCQYSITGKELRYKKFRELYDNHFYSVKDFLFEKEFILNQHLDYQFTKYFFQDFCKVYNTPALFVHDACYVPKDYEKIGQEIMINSVAKAIDNSIRNNYEINLEKYELIERKAYKISVTKSVLNNFRNNNLTEEYKARIKRILIIEYCDKVKDALKHRKKYNLPLSTFYTSDIHFNKVIELFQNNKNASKVKITKYINENMSFNEVFLSYLLVSLNLNVYKYSVDLLLDAINNDSFINKFNTNSIPKHNSNIFNKNLIENIQDVI